MTKKRMTSFTPKELILLHKALEWYNYEYGDNDYTSELNELKDEIFDEIEKIIKNKEDSK